MALDVVRIEPAEGNIPGLYDVQMSDGTWRYDLTHGQVRYLTDAVTTLNRENTDGD